MTEPTAECRAAFEELYWYAHGKYTKQEWAHWLAAWNAAMQSAEVKALRENYNELLFAVSQKHPGETRHQTALRYIQNAERPSDAAIDAARKEQK